MRPHVGLVLERSLGHVTHAETLTRFAAEDQSARTSIAQIDFDVHGRAAKIPVYGSNWTVRAGVRARSAIRSMHRSEALDALFIHTQVPGVLVPDWLRRVPTIVSLDATPLQFDELGAHYDHARGPRPVEWAKWRANRACFHHAAHVITWSSWARSGVIDGYDVDPSKVSVLPPGVDTELWTFADRDDERDRDVRILFVGGDLRRKGGDSLLSAFARLRSELQETRGPTVHLDLVTRAEVAEQDGVTVHRDLGPNSPALVERFHAADIFALPTRADCLGIALIEAAATGLPLISTSIGGVGEVVRDGETGLLVAPDDELDLTSALRRLTQDPQLRRRLGANARAAVTERFDARANTRRLIDALIALEPKR